MINAQHAHIYRIHPLHFIFGEIFFLKILSIQPLVEACRASDGANQCPGRYMGGAEKGGNENQFPYSLPTTKFFEFRWGQRRNWYVVFSPVTPPPDFVSKTFLGDITFTPRSIREPDNSSQTTMVSTSSKAVKVAPKMVGAGLENAATGSGMSERKRAASISPQKPRISLNFDGRRGRLGRTVRNESDVAAGATKGTNQPPASGKKTRSRAKEASGATTAPDGGDKIPKGLGCLFL